uniref:Uncharacterized protein n=1 Tax=Chrysemys picta bellii TaxID=8478 RepID=A0A8C3F8C3_CHRPI
RTVQSISSCAADIDECQGPSPADCGPHANCTNVPGSYYCTCIDGYESSSGKANFTHASENTCQDIDECQGPSPADCGPHAKCINLPGNYYCSCIDGYELSSGEANFTHTSQNTCQEPAATPELGLRVGVSGHRSPGYPSSRTVQSVPSCVADIDECQGPADCGPHANCTNVPGNYSCTCIDGAQSPGSHHPAQYRWVIQEHLPARTVQSVPSCVADIDECQGPNPADCGPHAKCTNVPGNYSCTCIDGYEPSSGKANFTHASENTCQGELSSGSTYCGPHAKCTNVPGNYSCSCIDGYESSTGKTNFTHASENTCQGELSPYPHLLRPPPSHTQMLNASDSFNSVLNSTSLWDEGGEGEVVTAVTLVLETMELSTLAIALQSPEKTTQNMMTPSMGEGGRVALRATCHEIRGYTLCPKSTGSLGAAAFISYSNLDSIISARRPKPWSCRWPWVCYRLVITETTFRGPVRMRMILLCFQAKKEDEESFCVYWKVVAGSGSWSQDGCTAVDTNSTHTTCSCDHLSSFAVLTESYPLSIITYMGLTLSLLCLFLAILTFLLCRSIRNISTSLLLQLCLCLFLADLLFLIPCPWALCLPQVACAVIAGLLHYLFLACFSWMFLEGLHLFLTVRNLKVMNYTSASLFKKRFMYPFGYGFPALVVAISAAVNPDGYGTSKHCWLSLDRGFRWSFLGPVCAIILVDPPDPIALHRVIVTGSLHLPLTRLLTFKAIAQLFVLGCTWSLGLLQVGPAATVMAYLFTIVNSLQGAFIFLVHCLLNRQVREEYRRWIKGFQTLSTKYQMSDLSMSAVPTTSTKTVRGPLLCSNTCL